MASGKKGDKALSFGNRIKYPIKITRLYKNPGDPIRKQEPILQYSFEYTMELPNDRETLTLQTRTLTNITDWNAPEDGKLLSWQVRVGEVIARDRPCATVEEACTHEVQFQGLCALCGRDMNVVNWASEQRDTDRAPINMIHDQTSLTVSKSAATRAESELQRRLLKQRKLSLVVDLDQTIIHACIDPTIGEWQQDPSNPNFTALRDVRRFQLEEGFQGLARGCWYYIKMRPRLIEFLEKISSLYEMHVYTMGTRTYALNIAQIVDPEQKYFGNRVISRDENGNIVAKSLQRLFPFSTHMVVIIDDRADVWPYNRRNLIKLNPYDFFKGTGDINSSFLPSRSDLSTSPASPPDSTPDPDTAPLGTEKNDMEDVSTSVEMADTADSAAPTTVTVDTHKATTSGAPTMASAVISTLPDRTVEDSKTKGTVNGNGSSAKEEAVDLAVFLKQSEEKQRTIEKQIKDRPLLHMQEQLDKEDEAAAAAAAAAGVVSATGSVATEAPMLQTGAPKEQDSPTQPRHCVLYDDDNELQYLEEHLSRLHSDFYQAYDSRLQQASQTSDNHVNNDVDVDAAVAAVPDVGEIMDGLKEEVLRGATIVLSGLVPLGLEVERSEIGLQAMGFGARLEKQISKKVTHLVISTERPRTQKVRQAARLSSIKIVNQHWLAECFSQWAWVDESPYMVKVHPADRERSATAETPSDATDSEMLSDQEDNYENGNHNPRIVITNPHSVSGSSSGAANGDLEADLDDDDDDGDASPIAELGQFDWGSADDELAMFLAEDDDEDEADGSDVDTESNAATDDDGDTRSRPKRKLENVSDTESERSVSSSRGRNVKAKRQRLSLRSRSRSSSKLRSMETVGGHRVTAPLPSHPLKQLESHTDDREQSLNSFQDNMDGASGGKSDFDIDEDDLEKELMAELAKEEAAEAAAVAAASTTAVSGQANG